MSIHKVTITGLYYAQRVQNVLHFLNGDGALTDSQICDEIQTNFVGQLKALQNIGFAYQTISSQRVDTATPPAPFNKSIVGSTGDLSGPGYHSSIAAIFTIRTEVGTRRGRGRFYMGGVHGASVLNGIMESGAAGAYSTKAGLLTSRYKSGGTGPIVLGVFPRGSSTSADFIAMSQLISRTIFGIQRRRNIAVGV